MSTDQLQAARDAVFNSETYRGPTEDITIPTEDDEVVLEVRSPRVKHGVEGLSSPEGNVKIRASESLRDIILDCVYHKATGKPFFEKEHLETLENASGHQDGLINKISNAIERLTEKTLETTPEDTAGN